MTSFFNQHLDLGIGPVTSTNFPLLTIMSVPTAQWRAVSKIGNKWYIAATGEQVSSLVDGDSEWVSEVPFDIGDNLTHMVAIDGELYVFTDRSYAYGANILYKGLPGFTPLTQKAMPAISISTVAYGNGKLIVIGGNYYDNYSAVSEDKGDTWTSTVLPSPIGNFARLRFHDGKFYLVSDASAVLVSSDGVTWDSYTLPQGATTSVPWSDIWKSTDHILALNYNSQIAVSFDPTMFGEGYVYMPGLHNWYVAIGYGKRTVAATYGALTDVFMTTDNRSFTAVPRTGVTLNTSPPWTSSEMVGTDGIMVGYGSYVAKFDFNT